MLIFFYEENNSPGIVLVHYGTYDCDSSGLNAVQSVLEFAFASWHVIMLSKFLS